MAADRQEEAAGDLKRQGFPFNDVLYGIINSIVGVPTMISFAAIIFKVGSLLIKGCDYPTL